MSTSSAPEVRLSLCFSPPVRIRLLLGLALLLPLAAPPVSGQRHPFFEELEPNDTPDEAQLIPMEMSLAGSFDRREPYEDWYRFTVPVVFASDSVAFELSARCVGGELALFEDAESSPELRHLCGPASADRVESVVELAKNVSYVIRARGTAESAGEPYDFDLLLTRSAREAKRPDPYSLDDLVSWQFWFARPFATSVREMVERRGRPTGDFPTHVAEGQVDLFPILRTTARSFEELRERARAMGGAPVQVRVLTWPAGGETTATFVFRNGNLWYAVYPPSPRESSPEKVASLFEKDPLVFDQEYSWPGGVKRYTLHAFPEVGVAYVLEKGPEFSQKVVAPGGPAEDLESLLWPPEARAQAAADSGGPAGEMAPSAEAEVEAEAFDVAGGPSLREHYIALGNAALTWLLEREPSAIREKFRAGLLEARAAALAVLEWEPQDPEALALLKRIEPMLAELGPEPTEGHPVVEQAEKILERLEGLLKGGSSRDEIESLHTELRQVTQRLELTRPTAAERFKARSAELWERYSVRLRRVAAPCPGCPALDVGTLARERAQLMDARAMGVGDYTLQDLSDMGEQGYAPLVTADFNGDSAADVALIGRGERDGRSTLFVLIASATKDGQRVLYLEPLDWSAAAVAIAEEQGRRYPRLLLTENFQPSDDFFYLFWNGRTFDLVYAGELMGEFEDVWANAKATELLRSR